MGNPRIAALTALAAMGVSMGRHGSFDRYEYDGSRPDYDDDLLPIKQADDVVEQRPKRRGNWTLPPRDHFTSERSLTKRQRRRARKAQP